ncbi:MAG: GNAT family N-acetyltransferase [Phreatobacter sp.]
MIRPADDEAGATACFGLMRQLRPHLADVDEFIARWRRQVPGGYRLVGLWDGDTVLALAGYRLQDNLVHGSFLHVDDLVTDESLRGRGHGEELLDWLKREAAAKGCTRLVLDTPLSNVLGHRFYYRNGLLAQALRFNIAV